MLTVVKAGGALIDEPAGTVGLVAQLRRADEAVVVVHGGGPQLDRAAAAHAVPTRRVAGRRITSPALLQIAVAEWRGRLSVAWVTALQRVGVPSVGLCGVDAGLLQAVQRPPVSIRDDDGQRHTVDFGAVGDLVQVRTQVIDALLAAGLVPVVAPLAQGADGQPLNVNADTVAAALAGALGARQLWLLSSSGLRADPTDAGSVVARTDAAGLDRLEAAGAVSAGMRPKLTAVRRALAAGVPEVHIADGRQPQVAGTLVEGSSQAVPEQGGLVVTTR
ncbi:MAG: acetylglutamate kinase [Myxococcales bacterium]|nr:acetylglutamate kinase [Myxococcales bacterium]